MFLFELIVDIYYSWKIYVCEDKEKKYYGEFFKIKIGKITY